MEDLGLLCVGGMLITMHMCLYNKRTGLCRILVGEPGTVVSYRRQDR